VSRRAALLAVLLGALVAGPAVAGPAATAAATAKGALVADLEALAAWCQGKRLFGKRDETWELLLLVEPDHARARHALGFVRDEAGAWARDPGTKPGINWARGELGAYEERRAAALDRHALALVAAGCLAGSLEDLAAVEASLEAALRLLPGDARLLEALRDAGLRGLAALPADAPFQERVGRRAGLLARFPDDERVREALGHVRTESGWTSKEVLAARARREEIARAAADAKAKAAGEVVAGTLAPDEAEVSIVWVAGFESPRVRVLGVAEEEGLRTLAVHAAAAGPFLTAVLGREPARPERQTLYVFAERDPAEQWVHKVPGLSADYLAHVLKAGLKGFSIGSSRYVVLGVPTADTQLDMGMLAAFDTLLQRTFAETPGEEMRGWVYEGLSRYLAFQLTGLRLSATLGGRYGKPVAGGAAAPSGDDVLRQAHEAIEAAEGAELVLLLGKHLDAFGATDSLLSYAFAAYLLEARPGEAAALVEAAVRGRSPDEALPAALGQPPSEVEAAFRLWLAEEAAPD
jgi:hypothetical protein